MIYYNFKSRWALKQLWVKSVKQYRDRLTREKTDRMMSFCIARILIRTVIQQSNYENVYLCDHISKAQDGFLLGHNFLIMVCFTLLFTPLVYGI